MTFRTTSTVASAVAVRPWYREPWPWLLMGGPALVVVAGCYTLWLAIASNDGLVADDYYKQGLAINKTLTRERAAIAAHYEARVLFAPSRSRVRIMLTGAELPQSLTLRLLHPTRAGMDYSTRLDSVASGVYEGTLDVRSPGRWRVSLEDGGATWRLVGEAHLPAQGPVVLGGR